MDNIDCRKCIYYGYDCSVDEEEYHLPCDSFQLLQIEENRSYEIGYAHACGYSD